MTIIDRTATPTAPMDSLRKTALAAGVLYMLTFVSIPTLALYGPVHDADYLVGTGPGTPVVIGGVLEVIVALAGIGTAVVLYPVVRRQREARALRFIGARILEAAGIFVGVASLLTVWPSGRPEPAQTRWSPARHWSPSMTRSSFSAKASFRP